MAIAIGARRLPIGAAVAAVGGVVAAAGAFLAWETPSQALVAAAGTGSSITGWDGGNGGKVVAVLGVVSVALAVAWLLRARLLPNAGFVRGVAGLTEGLMALIGVVVLFVGVVNFGSISSDVNDANAILPGSAAMGIGLYLDLLAGALIVVGGVLGILRKAA